MSMSTSFDTVAAEPRVLSGQNFREVAPEILSPLSWSIIGAGMEAGFRDIAARLRYKVPWGPPTFVAYVAFRPFHVMSSIERLWMLLPGVRVSDLWEFLLGGEPPADSFRPGARPRVAVGGLPRALRIAHGNGQQLGRVAEAVSRAERAVLTCCDRPTSTIAGDAWSRSAAAGRMAWALHIRTTAVAAVVTSWYRQVLEQEHGLADATELLLAHVRRSSASAGHGYDSGMLPDPQGRIISYEVADRAPEFTPWARRPSEATDPLSGPARNGDQFARYPDSDQLARSPLSPLSHRLARLLERTLAEREQSKAVGLRALHCVRCLLDQAVDGYEPREAAMLGAHELTRLPRSEQESLMAKRRAELEAVARLPVPVDCRQVGAGLTPIERSLRQFAGRQTVGVPLAPGWAVGPLVERPSGAHSVVFGEAVDASLVLSTHPAAVLTRYGSLLSHLAIVCRELGIPLVAGIQVDSARQGQTVEVDGWSGSVAPGGREGSPVSMVGSRRARDAHPDDRLVGRRR